MQFDAHRFLNDKGIWYKESQGKKGEEARTDCPLCTSGKRGKSLSINLSTGVSTCYRCGWSPRLEELILTILDCTKFEAEILVRRYSTCDLPSSMDEFERIVRDGLDVDAYDDKELPVPSYSSNGNGNKRSFDRSDPGPLELPGNWFPLEDPRVTTVTEYVLSRGFSLELCKGLGFGGCVFSKYTGCLIMPAYHGEELVFWQARDALGREHIPKYRTPPGYSPSNALFNLDVAVEFDQVILCEGIFSAMRVGRDAVACFGNKVSRTQIEILKKRGVENVVLCFDPDTWRLPEEAIRRGFTYMKKPIETAVESLLYYFGSLRVVRLTGTDDPDDTGTDKMRELINSAPVFYSFLEFTDKFYNVLNN